MAGDRREEIEALAYLIWEQQGRPENSAEQIWLEAEYQVLSRSLIHEQSIAHVDSDLHSRGLGSL